MSKQERADVILVGLEKIACLVDRCTLYELLYINGRTAASKNLEKSILRLYTAILKFIADAISRSKGKYSFGQYLSGCAVANSSQITQSRLHLPLMRSQIILAMWKAWRDQ